MMTAFGLRANRKRHELDSCPQDASMLPGSRIFTPGLTSGSELAAHSRRKCDFDAKAFWGRF